MATTDLLDRVKDAARGRWSDLLVGLGGCPSDLLDGKHHPCPKCGGKDRFRCIDPAEGALFCNGCLTSENGDGLSALQWLTGWDFRTTLDRVADQLGVARRVRRRPDDQLEVLPWNDALVFAWTRHKPGVTPEAVQAAGGGLARWHGEVVVFVPVLPPADPAGKPTGYILWNSTGQPLRRADGSEAKMLCTAGSRPGWIGRHGLELLASTRASAGASPGVPGAGVAGDGAVIWKVEGPTDALALWAALPPEARDHVAVLSNAFGSTEKPRPELLEPLRGRRVVVVHDEDEAGRRGGERWTRDVAQVAAEVRRVRLPVEGQDIRDYLSTGGTYAGLLELAAAAAPLAGASAAATREIRNFTVEELPKPDGSTRKVYHALGLAAIAESLLAVTQDWPKVYGRDLFVEDQDGRIEVLGQTHDLFAFLHRVCPPSDAGGGVGWRDRGADADGVSFLTRNELFSGLRSFGDRYQEVTDYPYEPLPAGVYVSGRRPGAEAANDHRPGALAEFCRFFRPASEEDEALIFALVLTVFWGGPPGGRPFFLVTGQEGTGVQELGKTSFVEQVASLVGGEFRLEIDERLGGDAIKRQVLSDEALHRRVILLDNLDGFLACRELAELLTAKTIDGRPVFGRQRARKNLLTWVGTAVSPALDSDLSSRSFSIQLAPPDRDADPTWSMDVAQYVREHRQAIVSEAIETLRHGARYEIKQKHSRYPEWDRDVLALHPRVNQVLRSRKDRIGQLDSDLEALALFLEKLKGKIPGTYQVSDLAKVWEEATNQRVNAGWLTRKLRAFDARGRLPGGLSRRWGKKHGAPWVVNPSNLEMEDDVDKNRASGEPSASPGEPSFWNDSPP